MTNAIEIGRFHELSVASLVEGGVLLQAGSRELFLPSHLTPTNVEVGQGVDVFIYTDRDGAPQATTKVPAAIVGEFAYLECVSVTGAGAFLDWGVPKDLYVPPVEQTTRMVEGRSYVVAICLDRKGERLMGSAHLSKHFDYDVEHFDSEDEVDLLVHGHSDAGVQVVVDHRYRGLIHKAEVHQRLNLGAQLRGYVHKVRHDNRLDVVLTRRGVNGIQDARESILAALEAAGGSLPLNDKSSPAQIERALQMSKKAFKRGVGGLYKARRIVMDERGISLVEPDSDS